MESGIEWCGGEEEVVECVGGVGGAVSELREGEQSHRRRQLTMSTFALVRAPLTHTRTPSRACERVCVCARTHLCSRRAVVAAVLSLHSLGEGGTAERGLMGEEQRRRKGQ